MINVIFIYFFSSIYIKHCFHFLKIEEKIIHCILAWVSLCFRFGKSSNTFVVRWIRVRWCPYSFVFRCILGNNRLTFYCTFGRGRICFKEIVDINKPQKVELVRLSNSFRGRGTFIAFRGRQFLLCESVFSIRAWNQA